MSINNKNTEDILLSICIVSYNVSKYLDKCLSSIVNYQKSFNIETIVVDNNSSDNSISMVESNYPQVVLIKNDRNKGFAAANNDALKICKGNFILLLNPDTILCPDSLENLISYLKDHPECGIVGPKLLNEDSSIQNGVRKFPSMLTSLSRKTFLKHLPFLRKRIDEDHMRNFDLTKSSSVNQVSGAAMMFSRKTFEKIGLLDERFFIFFEEVDYCQRVVNCDLNVFYYTNAEIYHLGGKSRNKINFKINMIYLNSQLKYLKKHNHKLSYFIFIVFFKTLFLTTLLLETIIDILFIPFIFIIKKCTDNHNIHKKIKYRSNKTEFRYFFIQKEMINFIFKM